ncbi:MAG: protein kinase [Gemmatimonadetes bacterium]|nr:protein kinase [Gemmatimonadota bacterium]
MDRTGDDRSGRRDAQRAELLECLRGPLADRYVLEDVLEDGPIASVVRARDVKHGRQVSLKVLRPALSAAVEGQRFLREIDTIAGLSHPHIVTLIDSGDVAGLYYYVVPHVEGESLRRRLDRERQIPVDEAVRIAIDVADGLDHAHRRGVVHRDINPATILLSEGHATIADFGVARAIDSAGGERLTAVGVSLGTPAYASPEQLAGEEMLGARADVYSLGCVLYEMLVGEPPLAGPNLGATIQRRLREDAPSARALRGTVPAALDEAIRTAMARLPADRFGSASELREALRDVARGPARPDGAASAPPDGRRLAAVFALDMVGYSRLMEADEADTLARQQAVRSELIDPAIESHRGRVVKGTGDGLLAEFASAVDAVECAAEIQKAMSEREADTPVESRIQFRIGINVGDIVARDGDIFGDGVNVAARIESLADPGGILVSQSAYDQVHNKVKLGFEDFGSHPIKNLEKPVHVYRVLADSVASGTSRGWSSFRQRKVVQWTAAYFAAAWLSLELFDMVAEQFLWPIWIRQSATVLLLFGLLVTLVLAWNHGERGRQRVGAGELALLATLLALAAGSVWTLRTGPADGASPDADVGRETVPLDEPVLAVLPFTDLSPGGDQAYFADGLHEELLHQLAVLRGLHLTSRTSVEHFRGSPSTVRAIADSLGARYAMEGSVRRAGDSIRVTVQLIDAAADEHIWSETYDARLTLDEIFAVQTRIAEGVAGSLGGTFAAGASGRLGRVPTSSLDAYNFYLRALYHYNRATAEDLEIAAAELERAVALDPEFGRAHGLLGLVYVVLRNRSIRSTDEAFPIVRRQAEIAMRLAPDEPESRMAQTAVYWTLEWDWEAARQELERVLELDPNSSLAPWALAEWYGVIAGDTEQGLRQIANARRVDPLSPRVDQMEAWVLYVGRRNSESAEILERVHRAQPDDPVTTIYLAQMLAAAGRRDEAADLLSGVLPNVEDWQRVEVVMAYVQLGEIELAREHMARALAFRESGGQIPAIDLSIGFAFIGETEAALDWLERSFREEGGSYMLRHPGFDSLRGEPRFQALWDEVGLPGAPPSD